MRKILLYTTAALVLGTSPVLAIQDDDHGGQPDPSAGSTSPSQDNGIPWDALHDYIYGLGAAVSRAGGSGVTCGSCHGQLTAAPLRRRQAQNDYAKRQAMKNQPHRD